MEAKDPYILDLELFAFEWFSFFFFFFPSGYIISFSLGEKALKTKEQKQNKTKPKNSSYQALNISFWFIQLLTLELL